MEDYRRHELERKQRQYTKMQQMQIRNAEQNMKNNLSQVSCRLIPHCKFEGTAQHCMVCSQNRTKRFGTPDINYFKPKIAGITVLP